MNKPRAAIRDLDKALRLDPKSVYPRIHLARAYHNRGALYHDMGKYALSRADAAKAHKLDPDLGKSA